MTGCKFFSKLDLRSAFHQLELDDESRYITVFNADGRLVRHVKLTMGNTVASGELSKALRLLLDNVEDVYVIHDDITIAARSQAEHDRALNRVLEILQEQGLTLNADKCRFDVKEIKFWGIRITEEGFKPDPEKVQAFRTAERPQSKEELVSFVCMVQSHSEFIPDLARHTSKLRELTKKSKRYVWTKDQEKEFKMIEDLFCEDTLLRFYDPHKHTFIFVDAHRTGLGAVLAQGKSMDSCVPVAVASRTTNDPEKRYPQIDLEGMAVDFGLRRFRQYLVGGPEVTIVTDHKPLISIFARGRLNSIRIDRIKLRHQDIRFKVIWRNGKKNPADYLSRHGQKLTDLPKEVQEETKEFNKLCWFIHGSPYVEAITIENIQRHTERCTVLQKLKTYIQKGYIPKKDQNMSGFRKLFKELTVSEGGIILRGERIVLPASLAELAISKAHQGGHPGETNLKRRLRSHFWWPGMNKGVAEKIKRCEQCQLYTDRTTREPQGILETEGKAWEQVALDLFGPMPNSNHIIVMLSSS